MRESISQLLSLIGRDEIFDQYTRHDISHIDAMLASLDWLIPPSARRHMTPADWALLVLAIYFHDLGMLVTRTEFAKRDQSGFDRFCQEILFAGAEAADYEQQIAGLDPDERDRFLYQEYVRHHHAQRVRAWITVALRSSSGSRPRQQQSSRIS